MPTPSSTSVSPSYSYSASCTALVYPTDNYLATGVTYASVSTSSSGWVTGYYAVTESIVVSDVDLPVPEVIFLASELTII